MSLLRAFPKDEPTKKKFVGEMIGWSAKFGEYPAGDPEIHHVAGTLHAEGMWTTYNSCIDERILTTIQLLSRTKGNAILSSATKTRPPRSHPSNIPGTRPTTHILHPCTVRAA